MKNIDKKLQQFSEFLLIEKGIRQITIKGYCGYIKRMIEKTGKIKPRRRHTRKYIAWMLEQGYSYSHIHNSTLSIRWYMKFIKRPMEIGRQKKPRPLIKETLSEAEITRMLFNCKNIREEAILGLLVYSGIRNKELCGLRTNDLNLASNTIKVREGKGAKDRIIYISSECSLVLIKYIQEYQKQGSDYLFTTLQRNEKYTGFALRKLIKVVAKRAKIKKRVHPHLMRHSLATNMIKRGADLLTVKKQLGHAFIESTMLYIQSLPYGSRNAYEKFAPSYM